MIKILKVVLFILILFGLAALDYWFILKKTLSLWAGAALFLGLIASIIAFFFIKKYLLRRREKKFVHRIVQLDQEAIKSAPLHEREALQELEDHWKESINILKESYLKKTGNPLYALPWYVVIGESGSGKTSAIKNSRLSSPVLYQDKTAGITATKNCDWWFFKEAIILDTAGRYTIPIDDSKDTEEWEKFLVLLTKYRRRRPINGVIATIPADKLLSSDKDVLRKDGQNIRKRIDQLMRVTGARFPLYIMVTKIDLLYGFNDTFCNFSEEETEGAMGFINKTGKMRWHEVVNSAFASIENRLRDIRLNIIHKNVSPEPGVLLFPKEFKKLKPGLLEFMQAVFEDNPYQESPFIRGVYFSSARQDGQPVSEFLDLVGHKTLNKENKGIKGFFLRDFFSIILPGDKAIYTRAYEFIRWRRAIRGLGFLSWFILWAALFMLLTSSFFFNLNEFKNLSDVYSKAPHLSNDLSLDLIILEKYRIEVADLDYANKRWFLPRLGLNMSLVAEKKTKEHYINIFNIGFYRKLGKALANGVDDMDEDTHPDIIASYASHLIEHLNIIDAYLNNKEPDNIDSFVESTKKIMKILYPSISEDVVATLKNTFPAFLEWNPNRAEIIRNKEVFQNMLMSVVLKRGNLDWLVEQSIHKISDIQLMDFWCKPQLSTFNNLTVVHGAYTKKGQEHIEDFIKRMESVQKPNKILEHRIKTFWNWYNVEYYKAWQNFIQNFPDGVRLADTEALKETLATAMTTEQNPYWQLIDRAVYETVPSGQLKKPPEWFKLINEIKEIKAMAYAPEKGASPKEGIISKIEKQIEGAGKKIEQIGDKAKVEEDPELKKIIEQRPARAKVFSEYTKALSQIAPAVVSNDTCFKMFSDTFTEYANLSKSQSPFNLAYLSFINLKKMMTKETAQDTAFIWNLMAGPFEFLLQFATNRSSCMLQKAWDAEVLARLENTPKDNMIKTLYNKDDGLIPKFKDGPAKPFIVSGKYGYMAKTIYEKTVFESSLPLKSEFFRFLNAGVPKVVDYRSEYNVKIETLPITTNTPVKVKPIGNVLSLQCVDNTTFLYNYNFLESKNFRWSHEKCGDTTLKILFPNFSLDKIYKGQEGFIRFLTDFKTGSYTFTPDDFPDYKEQLIKAGVNWIRIRYKIYDAAPILNVVKNKGGVQVNVPKVIVSCLGNQ